MHMCIKYQNTFSILKITFNRSTCWIPSGDAASEDNRPTSDMDWGCYKISAAGAYDAPFSPVMIGGSAVFFWDTAMHASTSSLLDPVSMRGLLLRVLNSNYTQKFGLDAMSGQEIGYYYSFNAHSIFTSVATYIAVMNDTTFLYQKIDGDRVIDRLEKLALDWLNYKMPGLNIADYSGDLNNFLECVPSYIHAVVLSNEKIDIRLSFCIHFVTIFLLLYQNLLHSTLHINALSMDPACLTSRECADAAYGRKITGGGGEERAGLVPSELS